MNLTLWSWAYIRELLAACKGKQLKEGELKARIKHFLLVLEVTLLKSTQVDFASESWKGARQHSTTYGTETNRMTKTRGLHGRRGGTNRQLSTRKHLHGKKPPNARLMSLLSSKRMALFCESKLKLFRLSFRQPLLQLIFESPTKHMTPNTNQLLPTSNDTDRVSGS